MGGAFKGAALVTFCEEPASKSSRRDALLGFIFDTSRGGGGGGGGNATALVGGVTLVGLGGALHVESS
jgi:hypothetical protein